MSRADMVNDRILDDNFRGPFQRRDPEIDPGDTVMFQRHLRERVDKQVIA